MQTTYAPGYEFGAFRLEPVERRLTRDGAAIRVPPKVLDMLILLVERRGRVVSKEELLAEIWPGTFVEENNLTVNMTTLRRLLTDASGKDYVETVPKVGYRFTAEVRPIAPAPPEPEAASAPPPDVAPSAPSAPSTGGTPWPRVAAGAALLLAITAAAWSFSRPAPAAPVEMISSLVVAPFRSIAPQGEQAYLETGMADAINARLGALSGLRVPPLSSVRAGEEPMAAGVRLGVDAVLTGSVQRADERLRISVQLHAVRDHTVLLTTQFDEKFTDIFSVQDAIAQRVASIVHRNLSATDRLKLTRRLTSSPDAYDLYMRAREQWARRTPESVRAAIAMYQRAIAIDGGFPLAYAGLADAYAITRSGLSARERYPLAKAAAEKALALDHDLPEANTAMAFVHYKFENRWAESEARFKRALASKPDYALAHHWYGEMLFFVGRADESIAELKTAMAHDPDSAAILVDLVRSLLSKQQVDEADALVRDRLRLQPNDNQVQTAYAEVLAAKGLEAQAEEARWKANLLQGASETEIAAQRAAYKTGGIRVLLERQMAKLTDDWRRNVPGVASRLARTSARLGKRDETLAWLRRAIDLNEDARHQLKVFPEFDFLRQDPAFKVMLKQAALD